MDDGGLRDRPPPRRHLPHGDALAGGAELQPFRFTATLLLEPQGKGTKYTAIVMHNDEQSRKKHEAMGFHSGWGKALEQLVEHVKKTRA